MRKVNKRACANEDAATTFDRLAAVLSPWNDVSEKDLAAKAAMGLSAWANEKKPVSLGWMFAALRDWSRFWADQDVDVDPLSEEGLTRFCTSIKDDGGSASVIRQRLTAIHVISHRMGLVTPSVRLAYQNVRRPYIARKGRPQPMRALPLMVADIRRLVRSVDVTRPQDVRNVLVLLVLYEAMARVSELVGYEAKRGRLEVGTMLSDVTFEQSGTSLLRLHPRRPDVPGRTVRLSPDTTAWLRHWISMRGSRPGHLLAFWPPSGSTYRKYIRIGTTPVWYGRKELKRLATRHGVSGDGLTSLSLRLGRAVALLDAGISLSSVAETGGWSSPLRLAVALDEGLTIRRQAKARPEPLQLSWPRPTGEAPTEAPTQLELTLAYAA